MPEFFEEQITEVKEKITEETENVVEFNTPQGAEFVEQVSVVQEQFTEVQENIEVIEQSTPDGSKLVAGAGSGEVGNEA